MPGARSGGNPFDATSEVWSWLGVMVILPSVLFEENNNNTLLLLLFLRLKVIKVRLPEGNVF